MEFTWAHCYQKIWRNQAVTQDCTCVFIITSKFLLRQCIKINEFKIDYRCLKIFSSFPTWYELTYGIHKVARGHKIKGKWSLVIVINENNGKKCIQRANILRYFCIIINVIKESWPTLSNKWLWFVDRWGVPNGILFPMIWTICIFREPKKYLAKLCLW